MKMTWASTHRPGRDSGFTIASSLAAYTLIIAVAAASAALIVRAYVVGQHNANSDRAIQYATARIERGRQLNFHDIGFITTQYNTAVAKAPSPYSNFLPVDDRDATKRERTVLLGTANASQPTEPLLPYEAVKNTRDKFDIYTTITWGTSKSLGLPLTTKTATTDPGTSTTSQDLYTFKRVKVTVQWTERGKKYRKVNESTFAPREYDEAPPGVLVKNEG